MATYIYQSPEWPNFHWDEQAIHAILGDVRYWQGNIAGHMHALGFRAMEEATLATLTADVVKSSEIEGEILDFEKVRSSIARRLGMEIEKFIASDRNIDGVVEMMVDATQNAAAPLTEERLFGWHAALFPNGYSGMYKIEVARYRTGEMQIVSGAMGKEKIHYEAIEAKRVQEEMDRFIAWFNHENTIDPVLKAAIAHFWFIIIHPFDDGNGRIGRAITDMLLTRAERSPERYYSMSAQILTEKKIYYATLQQVQHSSGDITAWLDWFLHCLLRALHETEKILGKVLQKAAFWQTHAHTPLNERQRLMLNKLLDGFDGKLQSSKWAKIAKCSPDTALRDLKDLIDKGILQQEPGGGRSTNYELVSWQ